MVLFIFWPILIVIQDYDRVTYLAKYIFSFILKIIIAQKFPFFLTHKSNLVLTIFTVQFINS